MIDTHCHLSHIERDRSEVLAEARAAGVRAVVDIGMGLEESRTAVRLAGDGAHASVGLHPNDLEEFSDEAMRELRDLAASPDVVAIGETGLDFYRDRSAPDLQEASFRAHIELAKETDRTLVIHCRDAHADVLRVLDDAGPPQRVVMHCFSGDADHARACSERGFWCSFAGNLTYPRNEDLREAARAVPEELLLVETDAPFLAPVPHRGKPNRPALVVLTARALEEVRGAPVEALLDENAARAFALSRTG